MLDIEVEAGVVVVRKLDMTSVLKIKKGRQSNQVCVVKCCNEVDSGYCVGARKVNQLEEIHGSFHANVY